jgi:hypothetical protein
MIRETAASQMKKVSVKELSELDRVGLYHSPGAAEVLCTILNQRRSSLLLTCYIFDLPDRVAVLAGLLSRGVTVRMLYCKGQMKNPSCATQHESLMKLFNVVGAERFHARAYSPCTGAFSALHAKTWCADGLVLLVGALDGTW